MPLLARVLPVLPVLSTPRPFQGGLVCCRVINRTLFLLLPKHTAAGTTNDSSNVASLILPLYFSLFSLSSRQLILVVGVAEAQRPLHRSRLSICVLYPGRAAFS